jgi:DNA-binding LytR/AlgR family response regulator
LPRKILSQLIDLEPSLNLLEIFDDPIDAIKFFNSGDNNVDLIFLDIQMPNFTGFDFLNVIKSKPQIIIVSSDKNYAIDAYEYDNITDFLIKPIQKERFQKAVSKVNQQEKNLIILRREEEENVTSVKENELYITTDKRLINIYIPDIELIEAKGNFIQIKTSSESYITYSSLKKIENKLPPNSFLRVHRSFIINVKKIIDIQDNSILISKKLVPLSRRYKSQVLHSLNRL